MENTARIYVIGSAAVIISGVKLEDWKLVEEYAPEALKTMDKKGEPTFRIMTAEGTGTMNRYGVVWGTHVSEEGNATVTILLDDEVDNRKEAVMNVVGSALLNVVEIEKTIPEIIEEIHKKQEKVESCITQI